MNQKRSHTKLNDVIYSNMKIQPYLTTPILNNKQKELLYNLRSHCHASKNNFKKINRNNLQCIFKCRQVEDQIHTFSNCAPVLDNIEGSYTTEYKDIFGSLAEQSRVMNVFFKIEQKRIHMKTYHLLPGGKKCQDPCTFGVILNGAADASA